MKLRILGDSLRLRLSVADVEALRQTGEVVERCRFGAQAAEHLCYTLRVDPGIKTLSASFAEGEIVVRVPSEQVAQFTNTDEVGFDGVHCFGKGDDALKVLVEKDFKCLTPREGEEAYDGFPNPNTSC